MRTPAITHSRRLLMVAATAIAAAATVGVWAAASAGGAGTPSSSLAAADPAAVTAGDAGNASITERAIASALDRLLDGSPDLETVGCLIQAVAAGSVDGSQLALLASSGPIELEVARSLAATLQSCVPIDSLRAAAEAALGLLPVATTAQCTAIGADADTLHPALAATIVLAAVVSPGDASSLLATADACQRS